MAIQAMALGVTNPQIDPMTALGQGMQQRQQFDSNNIKIAQQGLETIGAMALGSMGGDIKGKADPALFEQGLDLLASQGINVEDFRGKPQIAPLVAQASMTAMQQLSNARDEEQFNLSMAKFQADLQQAAKGTANMQDFNYAQENPDFAEFVNPTKAAGLIGPASYQEYQLSQSDPGYSRWKADEAARTLSEKPPTESKVRNQMLASVIAPEAESLLGKGDTPGTYGGLTNAGNQFWNAVGLGNAATSKDFQRAKNSLKTIIASYLYATSGATANPGEVDNQTDILTPRPGEDAASVNDKRDRVLRMVNAVQEAAGRDGLAKPIDETTPKADSAGVDTAAPENQGSVARPTATNPETGATVEWDGSAWVTPE